MRVIVCGDRNWDDYVTIRRILLGLKQDAHANEWHGRATDHDVGSICDCLTVVEGFARGADRLAGQVADQLRVAHETFEADWEQYGKAAGPIRNQRMLDTCPDLVVAFHDNLATSLGTRDMVQRATKTHVPVLVIGHGLVAHRVQDELPLAHAATVCQVCCGAGVVVTVTEDGSSDNFVCTRCGGSGDAS